MYDDLDDAALDAKIIELRGLLEQVVGGGEVAVIAGEGRRKEFTRANLDGLQRLYDQAVATKARRENGGRLPGRAIGIRHRR